MDPVAVKYRETTKWTAICGVCGGPRCVQGGKACKACYSKPEIRAAYFNKGATKALSFVPLTSETVLIELKPRVLKPRKPRSQPFWDGPTAAVDGYWRPSSPGVLDALYAKENIWRPGQYEQPSFRKKAIPKPASPRYVPLVYPFVAKPRDDHADLLAVNSIVPQGIPGREDICQEIMLALWEKKITIEQLKANRADLRAFVRGFNKTNYESGGYAVSLDEPMHTGQSWHDVLADPASIAAM